MVVICSLCKLQLRVGVEMAFLLPSVVSQSPSKYCQCLRVLQTFINIKQLHVHVQMNIVFQLPWDGLNLTKKT